MPISVTASIRAHYEILHEDVLTRSKMSFSSDANGARNYDM